MSQTQTGVFTICPEGPDADGEFPGCGAIFDAAEQLADAGDWWVECPTCGLQFEALRAVDDFGRCRMVTPTEHEILFADGLLWTHHDDGCGKSHLAFGITWDHVDAALRAIREAAE